MPATIPQLIISSPYVEPASHWRYDRNTQEFVREQGRRSAGYLRATPGAKQFDDPGVFVELPLVNQIRARVRTWRETGYPGVSGVTRRLLDHWNDPEQREDRRFFFCQVEAIETLIWLVEAQAAERQGIEIPGDGGSFRRLCAKMATGSGKTIVMALLIAWQVLNKCAYPQDRRFSRHIFVVAPGLTVKSRLQVLLPSRTGNFYDEFNIVPPGMRDQLRQANMLIRNWHTLMPLDPNAGPRVVKLGPESNEAFCLRVLGEMARARNLLVINDEAHHAWRLPPKSSTRGIARDQIEEATRWVGGLDRIDAARNILTCYDFTATPFAPTGRQSGDETLFGWIVSDFGLNDAIESGLVKTPRVVVRDDGRLTADYKSRLYHIYVDPDVHDDLNRRAEEQDPLPDLVKSAYLLLGRDWQETAATWREHGYQTPPVMITVANRTETAARVFYALTHHRIEVDELSRPGATLRIDSRVLDKAEARDELPGDEQPVETGDESETEDSPAEAAPVRRSRVDEAELLRLKVDTIGQAGKPGEQIQHVVSVQMLSEGWDAHTVTHIMGLRAFESQLLCEQVVGRGLRRTSYEVDPETGLYAPEYVNIFGVPFTFLPHEGSPDIPQQPPPPGVPVYPDPSKRQFEIRWPSIVRVAHEYRPKLTLDLDAIPTLRIDATETPTLVEMAPILDGKPDVNRISQIDLEEYARTHRLQSLAFAAARDVYEQMRPSWSGGANELLRQVIGIAERFVASGRIEYHPPLFNQGELRRRILLSLNMNKLVQHIWQAINAENTETLAPVFDSERPIRSTADMGLWYTRKPRHPTGRSHINVCVFDSTWEGTEAFRLDQREDAVSAWVKNDHLGFEILYLYQGVVHKYRADFVVRLSNGTTLVLEVKGQDTPRDQAKRAALDEWVRCVNAHGGFGHWAWDVSWMPGDVDDILLQHLAVESPV